MGRYAELGMFRRLRNGDRDAVTRQMARLEIIELGNRHLRELSAGQRQRVLVAQGLVQEADLILLDEPATGLDIVSRRRILEVVSEEAARGRAVVMATHDLDDAALADHVLLLSGTVIASGPPEEVLSARHLSRAYGGRLFALNGRTEAGDDGVHGDHQAPPRAGS